MVIREDTHFLIDYVNPRELELSLRVIDSEDPKSSENIINELDSIWDYHGQSHFSNTTRRLQDLGLIIKTKGRDNLWILTTLGIKVKKVLDTNPNLYPDLMHFLHYSGSPEVRKYFLSYKWCSELLWSRKKLLNTQEMVSFVQSKIEDNFPNLYQMKIGGNFNAGGVNAWKIWLVDLSPAIFSSDNNQEKQILPRMIGDFQIALLSLDYLYTSRGYRYGDPILLNDELIDFMAGIFFLDINCFSNLLSLSSKLTRFVNFRETLAGTTITLQNSFTYFNL